MTAKEYLRQVYKLDRRIRITIGKAEKLREMLEYSPPSAEGSGGGSTADRMPDMISKIMEYEQKATELKAKYIDIFLEVEKAIMTVKDSSEREVLERRYLLFEKWEQIADAMNYTERRVFQLHGKALKNISLNFSIEV